MKGEELKMYTKTWENDVRPPEYLYGPSWKAMELYMEGGYKTPEEAKAAWEHESQRFEDSPPEDAPDFGTTMFEYHLGDKEWRCTMCLGPVNGNYKWCPHCGRKRRYK